LVPRFILLGQNFNHSGKIFDTFFSKQLKKRLIEFNATREISDIVSDPLGTLYDRFVHVKWVIIRILFVIFKQLFTEFFKNLYSFKHGYFSKYCFQKLPGFKVLHLNYAFREKSDESIPIFPK
jgi:hypothetical protein